MSYSELYLIHHCHGRRQLWSGQMQEFILSVTCCSQDRQDRCPFPSHDDLVCTLYPEATCGRSFRSFYGTRMLRRQGPEEPVRLKLAVTSSIRLGF